MGFQVELYNHYLLQYSILLILNNLGITYQNSSLCTSLLFCYQEFRPPYLNLGVVECYSASYTESNAMIVIVCNIKFRGTNVQPLHCIKTQHFS